MIKKIILIKNLSKISLTKKNYYLFLKKVFEPIKRGFLHAST